MSIFEVEAYAPTTPWSPLGFEPVLEEIHQDYIERATRTNERRLAAIIAKQSGKLFEKNHLSGIYRAQPAIKYREGDCRAHTEVIAGIIEALNLRSFIWWDTDTDHASALWIGEHDTWRVDGYTGRAGSISDVNKPKRELAWKLEPAVREAADHGEGVFILTLEETIETSPAPKELGDIIDPYHDKDHLICLPYLQGLAMLGAMGDMERYTDRDEGKWYSRREDLIKYLPANFI